MPKQPRKPDSRTLVDRLLDRIKNNRIAAAIIIAFLGIGAMANLTDSTKKLTNTLSSLFEASIAGEWKSELAEFYPIGPESMRLTLQEAAAGQTLGRVQFSGNNQWQPREFDLLNVKREGRRLTLSFDSGARSIGPGPKSTPLRETIVGEIVGGELHFVYQREGQGGVPFTARRITQASQLVDGRLAITYNHKEYSDHHAACTQLLQELTPPQTYKQSEPPDTDGNIHCVGAQPDGSSGFDQYENEVQQVLICPPNSRKTILIKETSDRAKRCECDGWVVVSGGRCAGSHPPRNN